MKAVTLVLAVVVAMNFTSMHALARADSRPGASLPSELKPWSNYLLQRLPDLPFELSRARRKQEARACGASDQGNPCIWPGSLRIALDPQHGLRFEQRLELDANSSVQLLSAPALWPSAIQVEAMNGARSAAQQISSALIAIDGRPYLRLPAGEYSVRGELHWKTAPEELYIADNLKLLPAQIQLQVAGEPLPRHIAPASKLSLADVSDKPAIAKVRELSSIKVVRKFAGSLPLRLSTQLTIQAPASVHELTVPQAALLGSKLLDVSGAAPPVLDAERALHFRLNAGTQIFTLESIFTSLPTQLSIPPAQPDWPSTEIWAWEQQDPLLELQVQQAQAVNPERAQAPKGWDNFPTFAVHAQSRALFTLQNVRQGKAKKATARLERLAWLDFSGQGLVLQDRLYAQNLQQQRLNMRGPEKLGRVQLNREQQALTLDPISGLEGVELRDHSFQLLSNSQLAFEQRQIPISNWDLPIDQSKLVLNMPPGWELLAAFGADSSRGTRLDTWNLHTILMLALFTLLAYASIGFWGAFVGALLFSLLQGEDLLLREFVFVALLARWSYQRFPSLQMRAVQWASMLLLLVHSVGYSHQALLGAANTTLLQAPEAVQAVQQAPRHSTSRTYSSGGSRGSGLEVNYNDERLAESVNATLSYVEGSFGALVMICAGLGALVAASIRHFKVSCALLLLAIGSFVLRSSLATFFNDVDVGAGYAQESYYENAAVPPPPAPLRLQSTQELEQNHAAYASPGIGRAQPSWSWRQAQFSWPEPVAQGHVLKLYLLPPALSQLLELLKLALLLALVTAVARPLVPQLRSALAFGAKGLALLAAALLTFSHAIVYSPQALWAQADTSANRELLGEIIAESLKPACERNCITTSAVELKLKGEQLTLEAQVHSQGSQVWALDLNVQSFMPEQIVLDDRPHHASRILHEEAGRKRLLIRVPNGQHSIRLRGRLLAEAEFRIAGGYGSLHLDIPGWEQVLLPNSYERISLRPRLHARQQPEVSSESLEPWFSVQRSLRLDEHWILKTQVKRLGRSSSQSHLQLPMLPGEQPLSTVAGSAHKGIFNLRFAPGSSEISWESLLPAQQELTLAADSTRSYSERWEFSCSERWTCAAEGEHVRLGTGNASSQAYLWQSMDQKAVRISARSLAVVPGTQQGIRALRLVYTPEKRSLLLEVRLEIEASVAGLEKMHMPPQSALQEFSIDGIESTQLLNNLKDSFLIKTQVGIHRYVFKFRLPSSHSLVQSFSSALPRPRFESEVANISYEYRKDKDRLTFLALALDPKAMGPSFGYYAKLLLLLLVLVCARLCLPELLPSGRLLSLGWCFAGLLLCQPAGIYLASFWLMIALLFALLSEPQQLKVGKKLLGVLALTGILIGRALYQTLEEGPDFGIRGTYSSANYLFWYLDASLGEIPGIKVLTLSHSALQAGFVVWMVLALYFIRREWAGKLGKVFAREL